MKEGETIYDSYPEGDREYNFSIPPHAAQDHNNDMVVATGDMLPPRKNCKQCGQCSAVFIKGRRVNVGHPIIARAFFKSWGYITRLKTSLFG